MKKQTLLFLFLITSLFSTAQDGAHETIHVDTFHNRVQEMYKNSQTMASLYFHYILEREHILVWEAEQMKVTQDKSNYSEVLDLVRKGDSIKIIGYVFEYSSSVVYLIVKTNHTSKGYMALGGPGWSSKNDYLNFWVNYIHVAKEVKKEMHGDVRSDEKESKTKSSGSSGWHSSKPHRVIHTGPRGGRYYINSNGNKTYIRH